MPAHPIIDLRCEPQAQGAIRDELAAFVLLSLASAADAGGLVDADVERLSQLADCSPSAIQKALRRLAAAGAVEGRGRQIWVDLAAVAAGPPYIGAVG
jgi:hypothetical protein